VHVQVALFWNIFYHISRMVIYEFSCVLVFLWSIRWGEIRLLYRVAIHRSYRSGHSRFFKTTGSRASLQPRVFHRIFGIEHSRN
jgi:hypothetical protein